MGWKATALENLTMHLRRERDRYEKFSVFPEHEGGKLLLDALIEEVERRANEERKAELACLDCGRPAPIHVFVGESEWRAVRPRHEEQGGILCLYCLCERLANYGYPDGSLRPMFSNGPFSAFHTALSDPPKASGEE